MNNVLVWCLLGANVLSILTIRLLFAILITLHFMGTATKIIQERAKHVCHGAAAYA